MTRCCLLEIKMGHSDLEASYEIYEMTDQKVLGGPCLKHSSQ